ncbi:methylmalonyl-CoA epimerase [Halosegnis marinus]|uniref:Methylmalonyl-CoA epimerase n=1 Tax=Halosegnis marinus TaxID=3034023 RepID=A0ABD5ZR59_9EURY|nr:methylmalonyl-CoA epimerase [Halosegnis sp. DT85]
MHFDHAGIATTEADSLVFLFEDLLDCEVVHEELFDGMKLVFLDLGNGYLELLEPTGEEGAIARYLDANGPGIHHLAFATEDIDAALERARDRGVDLIDEEPREGAWGHDVAFCHPKSTGGVLVEFVQH